MILQIDTVFDKAHISLSKKGEPVAILSNGDQKDHGAFLQPAIQQLLIDAAIKLEEIDAIAVVNGPGSYTGLRVGMASAKGLAFALNIPLITIGTLEMMTMAVIKEFSTTKEVLFCPMIDARRMEVFTALYTHDMNTALAPLALILEPSFFANWLLKNKVCFFGNGSAKWKEICPDKNAIFLPMGNNALALSYLAFQKFQSRQFTDLAYSEPMYIKEFYTNSIT